MIKKRCKKCNRFFPLNDLIDGLCDDCRLEKSKTEKKPAGKAAKTEKKKPAKKK